jgi:hypothetical protein
MLRYFCRGRLLLAGGLLLAFVALAHASFPLAFPLSAIVDESEWIVVAKVEKIDRQAPQVVLSVSEDLKGKAIDRRLVIAFEGDLEAKKLDHVPQLLKRLAPNMSVVVFAKKRGKLYTAFAYSNGTWFKIDGLLSDDASRIDWSLAHGERFLRRTYKGTTAELRQLLIDHLAGKANLPKENKNEPPGFGPEIPTKAKSGGL